MGWARRFESVQHYIFVSDRLGALILALKPRPDMENNMSKKAVKATLTSAEIEAQTAAFLKSGGRVEQVGKGKSGQLTSTGTKQINLKSS
ncbi:hypothetical protein [Marinobacter alkaliphilus]|uniref:Transcriptional regulator SutA RNAP-binding domain-containing protein n=1 Tax=Marinobacter alkaliphilus TaxID=254719 RepID=A0ABZ3E888_9GAMM